MADAGDSIDQKLEAANGLYESRGARLSGCGPIAELLERLNRKVAASQAAMLSSGVAAACRQCEEEEGGSCCGAGIENRYTPILLLMNLLLGVDLPRERSSETGCFFLGTNGCSLRVRHILCVNYVCRKIQDRLSQEDLIALQNITGEEMDTAFRLHELIKKHLSEDRF